MVRDDNGGNDVDNGALALSRSLLAHATASITAAWMMVRNGDGSRLEDGALPALSTVPCPLTQQQQQRQRRQMVAERRMVPWHCWPFVALLHGGNDGSGANNGHNYQGGSYANEDALALLGVPCLHVHP
jgi:hypothetical protein